MPAYRAKIRCAYADPLSIVKEPRVPKRQLTAEEKEDAKIQRGVNKLLREKKKDWEATLTPWTGDERMRLQLNTLSDAKRAFKLTDAEMLTLPHEAIASSPKSYYPLDRVKDLARRKYLAGAALADLSQDPDVLETAGVRKKYEDNGRRNKGNWGSVSSFQVPGSRMAMNLAKMRE
ncbi:hypothetical protein K438DRAFT_1961025 [Mycena galopus ATCC 62051]|nr:hypothetical protein K438DRAFT_1961025 [Mycena galopus ATCC 62051]